MERDHTIEFSDGFPAAKVADKLDDYINYFSQDENLKYLIEAVESRFKSRYFDCFFSISKNLNKREVENFSFIVMTVNCTLIETLYQFKAGLSRSDEQSARIESVFKGYFSKYGSDAKTAFYSGIRNGLIHQTQTKKNVVIRLNPNNEVYVFDNRSGIHYFDAYGLNKLIQSEYEEYFNDLWENVRNHNNAKVKKFIQKVKYLTIAKEDLTTRG